MEIEFGAKITHPYAPIQILSSRTVWRTDYKVFLHDHDKAYSVLGLLHGMSHLKAETHAVYNTARYYPWTTPKGGGNFTVWGLEWGHTDSITCRDNLWTEKSLREPFQQYAFKQSTQIVFNCFGWII